MFDPIWANWFRKETAEKALLEFLRENPVFQNLTDKELNEVERLIHRREYTAGEMVFRENEAGIGMYMIMDGQVQISVNPSSQAPVILADLRTSDFFGEMSLFDESPRSATATAIVPTVLLAFLRPDLFSFIERRPGTGVKIIANLVKIIGERLRRTNQELKRIGSPKSP